MTSGLREKLIVTAAIWINLLMLLPTIAYGYAGAHADWSKQEQTLAAVVASTLVLIEIANIVALSHPHLRAAQATLITVAVLNGVTIAWSGYCGYEAYRDFQRWGTLAGFLVAILFLVVGVLPIAGVIVSRQTFRMRYRLRTLLIVLALTPSVPYVMWHVYAMIDKALGFGP